MFTKQEKEEVSTAGETSHRRRKFKALSLQATKESLRQDPQGQNMLVNTNIHSNRVNPLPHNTGWSSILATLVGKKP